MIKIIIKITLSLLLLISSLTHAQKFQGKAVYQTKIIMGDSFSKRMDSLKMPDDRKAFMMKMIKKRLERVYELDFNKTQSVYKEQKNLEAPSENARFNRSTNDVFFKDVKNKKIVNKKESFGKIFSIKDSLTNFEWKLEKETKMIGNYLCLKATTKKVEKKGANRFRRMMRSSSEKKADSTKTPKKITVTAWYTPEIPVNNGPNDYHGLPGLILQVDSGSTQILCTKIILNPKDKTDIIAPTKGKEITQKDYDNLMTEKMKERRENFKNNRKKGGSSSRHGRF